MNTNQSLESAKASARALLKALKRQGLALSLGQALDVHAQINGFADWNAYAAVGTNATSSPSASMSKATYHKHGGAVEPLPEQAYEVYQVTGPTGAPHYVAAFDEKSAEAEALNQGLISANEPRVAKKVDAAPHSPFLVEVNGGFYNEFESIDKAVRVAQGLLSADDDLDESHVLMANGKLLIKFTA